MLNPKPYTPLNPNLERERKMLNPQLFNEREREREREHERERESFRVYP